MARWRNEALRLLPELKEYIESADQIMAFWIAAMLAFQFAYERSTADESLISRIYTFADWCLAAPRGSDAGHDPCTAVMIAFYESIPTIAAAREDMLNWFTRKEVVSLKDIFSYHIGETGFGELLQHMYQNRRLYRNRKTIEAAP